MHDIRILSIPRGKFNFFKHGNGFSPYESSTDVWILQVRLADNLDEWVNVPVVQYTDVPDTLYQCSASGM